MTTLSQTQLSLLAQAAQTLTELRELAIRRGTPTPPERIAVVPGAADLVVVGNQGLQTGFYGLEFPPLTPSEGVGESESPA
ncbi:hypothetical protein [Streptomyces sp. NPDC005732]|uniref:hypothetical protein n=1 Tax=Streptomyces sp. NPDC005732 TaxID=3157057 RepID=UPI0033FAE51B